MVYQKKILGKDEVRRSTGSLIFIPRPQEHEHNNKPLPSLLSEVFHKIDKFDQGPNKLMFGKSKVSSVKYDSNSVYKGVGIALLTGIALPAVLMVNFGVTGIAVVALTLGSGIYSIYTLLNIKTKIKFENAVQIQPQQKLHKHHLDPLEFFEKIAEYSMGNNLSASETIKELIIKFKHPQKIKLFLKYMFKKVPEEWRTGLKTRSYVRDGDNGLFRKQIKISNQTAYHIHQLMQEIQKLNVSQMEGRDFEVFEDVYYQFSF